MPKEIRIVYPFLWFYNLMKYLCNKSIQICICCLKIEYLNFVTTLKAIISTALQMIILDKIEVNIYKAPYIKVLK